MLRAEQWRYMPEWHIALQPKRRLSAQGARHPRRFLLPSPAHRQEVPPFHIPAHVLLPPPPAPTQPSPPSSSSPTTVLQEHIWRVMLAHTYYYRYEFPICLLPLYLCHMSPAYICMRSILSHPMFIVITHMFQDSRGIAMLCLFETYIRAFLCFHLRAYIPVQESKTASTITL